MSIRWRRKTNSSKLNILTRFLIPPHQQQNKNANNNTLRSDRIEILWFIQYASLCVFWKGKKLSVCLLSQHIFSGAIFSLFIDMEKKNWKNFKTFSSFFVLLQQIERDACQNSCGEWTKIIRQKEWAKRNWNSSESTFNGMENLKKKIVSIVFLFGWLLKK